MKEERTIGTSSLGLVRMRDGNTIAGGIEDVLRGGVTVIGIGLELIVALHGVAHATLS